MITIITTTINNVLINFKVNIFLVSIMIYHINLKKKIIKIHDFSIKTTIFTIRIIIITIIFTVIIIIITIKQQGPCRIFLTIHFIKIILIDFNNYINSDKLYLIDNRCKLSTKTQINFLIKKSIRIKSKNFNQKMIKTKISIRIYFENHSTLYLILLKFIILIIMIISKIKKVHLSTTKKNINIIKTFIIKTRLSKIFKIKHRKFLTKILLI